MQSTQLLPTQLTQLLPTLITPEALDPEILDPEAPDRISGLHERATLLEAQGRENKLFLTSLLLTSSLVTFVLTSLPQVLSFAKLLPMSAQTAQVQTAQVQTAQATSIPPHLDNPSPLLPLSQSVATQSAVLQPGQTLVFTVSPASSTNIILRLNPTPGAQVEAIATPHLPASATFKAYSLSVTIKPLPQ